jgi:hypothetical protein
MSHVLILARTDYSGDRYGDGSYGSGWYGEDDGIASETMTLVAGAGADLDLGTLFASDNFNRADENPLSDGGNWASPLYDGDQPLRLTLDQAWGQGASINSSSYWTTPFGPDQEVSIYVTSTMVVGGSTYFILALRQTGMGSTGFAANTGYDIGIFADGNFIIEKAINGVWTTLLDSYSAVVGIGDTLTFRAVGHVISFLINGVVIGSATDSSISGGGYVAVYLSNMSFDDFTASGDAPSAAGTLTLVPS